MREAHTQDYWKKITKYNYKSYVEKVDLNNYNGFKNIEIGKGIQVICGLNGAGKTTLLSSIKDLLGISLDRQGVIKLEDANVVGNIFFDENLYHCKNIKGERLCDKVDCLDRIGILEYFNILRTLDIFWNQENLDELIEQNELIELCKEDIDEINYLVGRQYKTIALVEIEDMNDLGTIPYFIVTAEGVTYDSCKMGMGEYCLMYIYWFLKQVRRDSIILIEEPESFVAIKSQRNLMNFIAKKSIDNGISFVISTHSPFIIERVANINIRMISRAVGRTAISIPNVGHANLVLGAKESVKGTLLVEDDMAKEFLSILLEKEDTYIFRNYDIKIAGSSSEISNVLKIATLKNIKHNIIGVYDKDQENENMNTNVLPFVFLPLEKDVESNMKKLILDGDKIEEVSGSLHKNIDDLVEALARVNGEDHHDWLRNLAKYLCVDVKILLEGLYDIWKKDNEEVIDAFTKALRDIVFE